METCFRIIHKRAASTAFSGEGARRFGGRWNNKGTKMIYAAGSLALAAMEVLVHLDSADVLGEQFCYFKMEIPAGLCIALDKSILHKAWDQDPPTVQTKQIGDDWVRSGASAVIAVPSSIIKSETNFLLNPSHPDFARITIGSQERFAFDPRLVK